MKAADLRNMTADELRAHHDTLVDELANLRLKLVLRQLENPMRVRILRRDIARTKTILRQKTAAQTRGTGA
jgi:large subunit ribosomal protein L29